MSWEIGTRQVVELSASKLRAIMARAGKDCLEVRVQMQALQIPEAPELAEKLPKVPCMLIGGDENHCFRSRELLDPLKLSNPREEWLLWICFVNELVCLVKSLPHGKSRCGSVVASGRLPELTWKEEVATHQDQRTSEEKALQELFYAVVRDPEQENVLKLFLKGTKREPVIIEEAAEALGRSAEHVSGIYNDWMGREIMVRAQGFELTERGHTIVEMLRRKQALLRWLNEDEKRVKFLRVYHDIDDFEVCNSMLELAVSLPMTLEPLGVLALELCRRGIIWFDPEGQPDEGFVLTPMGKALWHQLSND